MGFVIWYQLVVPDIGLRVSNDVLSGDHILAADITVDMVPGTFHVTVADLPPEVTRKLIVPLGVTISLGYLDDPASRRTPVLNASITRVSSGVRGDGTFVTELSGYSRGFAAGIGPPVTFADDDIVCLSGMDMAVLGDPGLRPGQQVRFRLKEPRDMPPGELRIGQVRHDFFAKCGYTSYVTLVPVASLARAGSACMV